MTVQYFVRAMTVDTLIDYYMLFEPAGGLYVAMSINTPTINKPNVIARPASMPPIILKAVLPVDGAAFMSVGL